MLETIRSEQSRLLGFSSSGASRRLWLWLLSIGCLLGSFGAQAQTAIIGSTSVPPVSPATATYFHGPIYRSSTGSSFDYSRYAYLYTAAELSAAGINPGVTITNLGWLKADGQTITGGNNFFEVRLANTTQTSLTTNTTWGTLKTGTTVGYTSNTQDVTGAAGTYFNVPITNFVYTGGSLLVLTDWVKNGASSGAVDFIINPSPGLALGNASGSVLTDASILGGTSYSGERATTRITAVPTAPCTAPPTAGTAVASRTSGCGTVNVNLSLNGASFGAGLTYQWQQSPTGAAGSFTNIAGATSAFYQASVSTTTTFRAVLTCSGQSANSTPVTVTIQASPAFAALPVTQDFETWTDRCETMDVPGPNWRNVPPTGNNSWRRDDQGSSAGWSSNLGSYTPAFTTGAHSARFHTYNATSGDQGSLDLFFNGTGTAGTPTLTFDYINTSGSDQLEVLLSVDGGTSFGSVLATRGISADWSRVVVPLPAATATSVVRLRATSDFGLTDIGVDNLSVALVTCPQVSAIAVPTLNNTSATLTLTGATGAANYTVTYTPAGGTPTTVTPAPTTPNVTLTGLTPNTVYTVSVTANCGGTNGSSAAFTTTFTTRTLPPLSGAYTINNLQPTGSRNFASFSDAATALNDGSVSGAVTFAVSNGPYTEQMILGEVAGASSTNTITFNGNGRTIKFAPTVSASRGVIILNGTDYVTLDNLVVDATNAGAGSTYGFGIQLYNNANNNIIRNNTVTTNDASTSANYIGISVSGSATGAKTSGANTNSNVTVEGNTVNGGDTGITLIGNSTASPTPGLVARNNTVNGFYNEGIYTTYTTGVQIIGNDVARPVRSGTVSTFYGIYVGTGTQGARVERNRVHQAFAASTATSTTYGMYVGTGSAASAGSENVFANNLIYDLDGNGTVYGIFNTGSAFARYYHNTININDQTYTGGSVTRGFYNTSSSGVEFINNIVQITRGGTGDKQALYFSTTAVAAGTTSNYNDLAGTGTDFVVARINSPSNNYATLADWQTNTLAPGKDANSVSVAPGFVSASNLTPTSPALNNAGTTATLTIVPLDFAQTTRTSPPDIGAYEFTPTAIDLSPIALVSPAANASCYGAAEPIVVQVRNTGTGVLNFANNAANVSVVVTPPTGPAQTFTGTVNTGTLASGATQNVTLTNTLNMTALGTYSFAVTASATGDNNTSNDVLVPAPTRTVVAPTAGTLSPSSTSICVSGTTGLNLAGSANGNIQYQSSTSATGTFTDIAGATSAAFTTPVLTSTTYYRAKVSCNGREVFSNVSTITVNNPTILTAPAATTCAGGTAQLLATAGGGGTVQYFTSATGGTALTSSTTGGPFTTPALTTTTTYYAASVAGSQENVGKPSTNGANGTNASGGLYFTATGPTTITNVTVYRTANAAAGTATIELLSGNTTSSANLLSTITVNVPANTSATVSPTVLTLNFPVPAAGQYTLYLRSASPNLIRDSGTTAQPATSYPYTSPSGVITITDATLAGFYYFFYNWQIGSECVSATRTPITVTVTPGLVATLPQATATICGATPYALNGAFAGTATGLTYTSTGTGTFTPNATTPAATYTPSPADITSGTVTITATPTGPTALCTNTAQVVLTIQTPPNASFSYPTGTYCTGATSTVTPTLATGATAGTFTASGTGLRIDPVTGVVDLATSTGAGTYTITNTVAGTGVCNNFTSTATITLNFGAATPTLTSAPQPNGTVRLSVLTLPNVTYQFYRNGTAVGTPNSTGSLTLTGNNQSGSYTVVAITAAGCQSAPSAAVSVTVTSARSTVGGLSLLVAPNPTADGLVRVKLSGASAGAPLTVLNALGQVVRTGAVGATATAVDLSDVAAGVYVLRVTTPQGVLTHRLVRQ